MSRDSYLHRVLPGEPGGPLLIVGHGTGGDENQFAAFAGDLVPGATVVLPRGDVSEFGAPRFFRRTGEGVYDMADLTRASAKMAGFVRAHAEALRPSSVLGLGYSNGANILVSALFADPGLFDALALLRPLIPFEPKVEGGLAGRRILISAGRRDPICPPALTARLDAYLRAEGADVTLNWREGGHELGADEHDIVGRFLAAAGESA